MSTYFAEDGSYGNSNRLFVVDTTQWTLEDWTEVELAFDSERIEMAKEISDKYTKVTAQ